jgi:tRNA pseudouridine55 synthase
MPDEAGRAGMLLVDKPIGISSFAALGALRRRFGRRLGHAGTLDPFATGLLLVLIGRATRLQPYLVGLEKTYTATVAFGATSTTDDPEGTISATGRATTAAAIQAQLPALTGVIEQVPPAASAVHIEGERAYRRFRRGEDVTVPSRLVSVHRFELLSFDATTQTGQVAISCGAGTYVRSLARDLGARLGCGAYVTALRRTAIGPFDVRDAVDPEDPILEEPRHPLWRSPAEAVGHLPRCRLTAETERATGHGSALVAPPELAPGAVALIGRSGSLVAIADAADGLLRPRVVLEPR